MNQWALSMKFFAEWARYSWNRTNVGEVMKWKWLPWRLLVQLISVSRCRPNNKQICLFADAKLAINQGNTKCLMIGDIVLNRKAIGDGTCKRHFISILQFTAKCYSSRNGGDSHGKRLQLLLDIINCGIPWIFGLRANISSAVFSFWTRWIKVSIFNLSGPTPSRGEMIPPRTW